MGTEAGFGEVLILFDDNLMGRAWLKLYLKKNNLNKNENRHSRRVILSVVNI